MTTPQFQEHAVIELPFTIQQGTEALSMARSIWKFLDEARKKGEKDQPLVEVLSQLRTKALHMAKECETQIASLLGNLSKAGVNIDRPINALIDECSWYNWPTKSMLKSLRAAFQSMYLQLSSLVDDVTAVLVCSQKLRNYREAFQAALIAKQDLDKVMQDYAHSSVKLVLERMRSLAQETSHQFSML